MGRVNGWWEEFRVISAWKLVVVVGAAASCCSGAAAQTSGDEYEAELAAAIQANSSATVTARDAVVRSTSPPWVQLYFSDFEADDGGLIGSGDWEWGPYAWAPGVLLCENLEKPPTGAYSGSSMWGTTLGDCYTGLINNADEVNCTNVDPNDDSILSLTVDLRSVATAWMTWAEWFDVVVIPGFDWVEIRVDGVVVEQRCGTGYDNSGRDQWRVKDIDLTPWAGTEPTISFHMMASQYVNYSGWYIDDLEVTNVRLLDVVFVDGFEGGNTDAWSSAVP